MLTLFARTGPVARAVLLILIVFSVVSWGITLYKLWTFRRAERQTSKFLDVFRKSAKFSEAHAACAGLGASPLAGMFKSGYAELMAQLRHASQRPEAGPVSTAPAGSPAAVAARPTIKSLDALDRALLRASAVEVNRLEHHIGFLATTASITPFIGLFGTVWGIMESFESIAQMGSTNIAVVAPGIAEALVNTAAGLFAAIPALYFYNHFAGKMKLLTSDMDDFALEFLNISERNFT
ncbi:MAG: Tol-Pal system subunit TolQ [Acidobacteria bacterium]|nr:MAG: Tol-Pal system subunit TolQ [Acidobacteriota bacterium]